MTGCGALPLAALNVLRGRIAGLQSQRPRRRRVRRVIIREGARIDFGGGEAAKRPTAFFDRRNDLDVRHVTIRRARTDSYWIRSASSALSIKTSELLPCLTAVDADNLFPVVIVLIVSCAFPDIA